MRIYLFIAGLLLIGLSGIGGAAAEGARTPRQHIDLEDTKPAGLPFSDAVLVGNTLYISGNGGIDPVSMKVPEDPRDEARLLMENYRRLLQSMDMTMNDLVSVTVYCPDLSLYRVFNEVYREYFHGAFPARAFVGSGPLLFGMRFEMQAIAVK